MKNDRTYVMGYWLLPDNSKNSVQHYSEHMQETLSMLSGSNLIFVSADREVQLHVAEFCRHHNVRIAIWDIGIPMLEKFEACKEVVKGTIEFGNNLEARSEGWRRDKGLAHYWRDFRRSNQETWHKLLAIWHSKCDLLHKAALENPFCSVEFAWVDASLSRMNGKRPEWNFPEQQVEAGKILHYGNGMLKNGQPLFISAGFLLGDQVSVRSLKRDFDEAFTACLAESYPNDEEVVLDAVLRGNPDLFVKVGSKVEGRLTAVASFEAAPQQSWRWWSLDNCLSRLRIK